jgi:hypothetical protein
VNARERRAALLELLETVDSGGGVPLPLRPRALAVEGTLVEWVPGKDLCLTAEGRDRLLELREERALVAAVEASS